MSGVAVRSQGEALHGQTPLMRPPQAPNPLVMSYLSVLATTCNGSSHIVLDLGTGTRLDHGDADLTRALVPRCVREDLQWRALRRLTEVQFDPDPRVILSKRRALVEGHAPHDFDKMITLMVDTATGRVVDRHEARPLCTFYSAQFDNLGSGGGPGGPEAMRFAVLGWLDDYKPAAGINWALRIWDGEMREHESVPYLGQPSTHVCCRL